MSWSTFRDSKVVATYVDQCIWNRLYWGTCRYFLSQLLVVLSSVIFFELLELDRSGQTYARFIFPLWAPCALVVMLMFVADRAARKCRLRDLAWISVVRCSIIILFVGCAANVIFSSQSLSSSAAAKVSLQFSFASCILLTLWCPFYAPGACLGITGVVTLILAATLGVENGAHATLSVLCISLCLGLRFAEEVRSRRTFLARRQTIAESEGNAELLHNLLPHRVIQAIQAERRCNVMYPAECAKTASVHNLHKNARLLRTGLVESFEGVSILFADVVGFTSLSTRLHASALVAWLDELFSAFDIIVESYNAEKIKTMGDAYMAAAGLGSSVLRVRSKHVGVAARTSATSVGSSTVCRTSSARVAGSGSRMRSPRCVRHASEHSRVVDSGLVSGTAEKRIECTNSLGHVGSALSSRHVQGLGLEPACTNDPTIIPSPILASGQTAWARQSNLSDRTSVVFSRRRDESSVHAQNACRMAHEMIKAASRLGNNACIRVGIHTGFCVAGVLGRKRLTYDIWGEAVNIASRLESTGEPGKIHISASTADLLNKSFALVCRGEIDLRGAGTALTFFASVSSEEQ